MVSCKEFQCFFVVVDEFPVIVPYSLVGINPHSLSEIRGPHPTGGIIGIHNQDTSYKNYLNYYAKVVLHSIYTYTYLHI